MQDDTSTQLFGAAFAFAGRGGRMKHLGELASVEEIRERLLTVQPVDSALWGRMNAAQMVCHLREAFRLATGETSAAAVRVAIPRPVMKWLALRAPMQWPQSVPTVPELKQGAHCMPVDFAADRAGMLQSFECFCSATENRTVHPFFGTMKPKDWMRWGYLHADHHLRQFGR